MHQRIQKIQRNHFEEMLGLINTITKEGESLIHSLQLPNIIILLCVN